ncbi:MAG: succinyl-diaminopimelate desuccinylase [Proteobacteria bacterium]|jgi:succinyl-diaminopimelate desuccinylase|nr:succinyl-diaminopimelate desuccinylase [Pseudomonadota bacterium]MDA1301378.1 succinyl-diaminopimelate desuccinylase [Pseudomonadota bacterium]
MPTTDPSADERASENVLQASTLALTQELISRASVSPDDGGCQDLLTRRLSALGFDVEPMPFGDVTNFWAVRPGSSAGPILAFAGHTDVVPTGPINEWKTDPFTPVIEDGHIIGRGAADMKGSLAAMITGLERFLASHRQYAGALALLITSDEEADAINGTVKVMETLRSRGTHIDWCVVGEPSSSERLGDVIRVGRRGSLNASLTVTGQQGHVAYPNDAVNPIHVAAPAIAELTRTVWDNGSEYFPPTTMQISNMNAGTGATNIIPGTLTLAFNFRFSTESTQETLQSRTEAILDHHGLNYQIDWRLSGQPFITQGGRLIPAVQAALQQVANIDPELSTAGGTSDGRFIAPAGTEVVELGPCNATIHKVNERTRIEDLNILSRVYTDIMLRLLASR